MIVRVDERYGDYTVVRLVVPGGEWSRVWACRCRHSKIHNLGQADLLANAKCPCGERNAPRPDRVVEPRDIRVPFDIADSLATLIDNERRRTGDDVDVCRARVEQGVLRAGVEALWSEGGGAGL